MKLLKYFAILAVLSISGLSFAQAQAPVDNGSGVQVSTSVDKGVVKVESKFTATNPLMSSEEALEKATEEAIKAVGPETNYAKAIRHASAAIRASLSDSNHPAQGPVSFTFTLTPNTVNDKPIIDVVSNASVGGEALAAQTRSSFNADGSIKTTGNVNVNNSTLAAPVSFEADASGKITGIVGNKSVGEKAPETILQETLTTPASDKEKADGGRDTTPDNTLVTSGR